MNKLLSVFFSPKGMVINAVAIIYICFVVVNTFTYLDRYEHWKEVYNKKLFYNQLDICQDSRVKAKLEKENKCDDNAIFLSIPVWRRAVTDVIESIYVCSGGTCQQWFNQVVLLFGLCSILFGYIFLRHTAWVVQKTKELKSTLPTWFSPDHEKVM